MVDLLCNKRVRSERVNEWTECRIEAIASRWWTECRIRGRPRVRWSVFMDQFLDLLLLKCGPNNNYFTSYAFTIYWMLCTQCSAGTSAVFSCWFHVQCFHSGVMLSTPLLVIECLDRWIVTTKQGLVAVKRMISFANHVLHIVFNVCNKEISISIEKSLFYIAFHMKCYDFSCYSLISNEFKLF